jgi:hypothetical protein
MHSTSCHAYPGNQERRVEGGCTVVPALMAHKHIKEYANPSESMHMTHGPWSATWMRSLIHATCAISGWQCFLNHVYPLKRPSPSFSRQDSGSVDLSDVLQTPYLCWCAFCHSTTELCITKGLSTRSWVGARHLVLSHEALDVQQCMAEGGSEGVSSQS